MMNAKKLIVFLLWAFLPMVIVGVVMHLSGASTAGLAGFIVLLIMDVFLYLYDKYISKEKVFATVL